MKAGPLEQGRERSCVYSRANMYRVCAVCQELVSCTEGTVTATVPMRRSGGLRGDLAKRRLDRGERGLGWECLVLFPSLQGGRGPK